MKNEYVLTLNDIGNSENGNVESLFAQANGFIGVRASLPIKENSSNPGSFVNGYFESHDIIYGENAYGYAKQHQTMVKLFDLRSMKVMVDGESPLSLLSRKVELQMKEGILTEQYLYETRSHKVVRIDIESFASHYKREVYAQKYVITAENFEGVVSVEKRAEIIQPKNEHEFDPRHKESSTLLKVDGNRVETINSQLSLFTKFEDYMASHHLEYGGSFEFTLLHQVSREDSFHEIGYDELRSKQLEIFQNFWDSSDVELDGDPHLQKGIRFNLYHMFNSAGRDGKTNFGAKGLTGEGYEGHYFWDTEMYLLPFFTFTQPEIAKALLTYRISILDKARARAKELSFKGALFPWRTIGGEETSAFFPAGTAQIHINGDIVKAFELYETVTGDSEFIEEAKDVIFETARFWMSYGFISKRGFEIHEVTGPDEYTALVNNNYYTNKMAQNNLAYAEKLATRLGVLEDEKAQWAEASQRMYFSYDEETGVTAQDDTFLKKEVWPFDKTPEANHPLLLHYHPMKIYKYQVLKQADTVLAHMIYPTDKEQMERDFDYYEPLTTHDSSLSRAVYGVIASHLGRKKQAFQFFSETAVMDLVDMQGNASHGIHAANMGGSWLGLIYGFAGLTVTSEGEVSVKNQLPNQIKRLSFTITVRGKKQKIVIE
jgi:alpha,alpha-trehalose phosphorylase